MSALENKARGPAVDAVPASDDATWQVSHDDERRSWADLLLPLLLNSVLMLNPRSPSVRSGLADHLEDVYLEVLEAAAQKSASEPRNLKSALDTLGDELEADEPVTASPISGRHS